MVWYNVFIHDRPLHTCVIDSPKKNKTKKLIFDKIASELLFILSCVQMYYLVDMVIDIIIPL